MSTDIIVNGRQLQVTDRRGRASVTTLAAATAQLVHHLNTALRDDTTDVATINAAIGHIADTVGGIDQLLDQLADPLRREAQPGDDTPADAGANLAHAAEAALTAARPHLAAATWHLNKAHDDTTLEHHHNDEAQAAAADAGTP